MDSLDRLLTRMTEVGASDLYLKIPSPPTLRVDGELRPEPDPPVTHDQLRAIAERILRPHDWELLERDRQVDASYSLSGVGRFRVNVFYQRGTLAMVIRNIRTSVPPPEELGLPPVVTSLAMEPRGLILVVGATGSGKSTTLASMVDYRNTHSRGHIITIEDPIEFLHRDRGCLVTQREVGVDVPSYHEALRAALRQTPDVLLLGEIRDTEAAAAALHLAETGHVVLGTLHCTNASQTLERLVQMFAPDRRMEICSLLSQNLRGVIAQRLVRRTGGGLVLACEVMLNTPRIRELIRKFDIHHLRDAIAQGSRDGMQTFDQALFDLYERGLIAEETALASAESPNDLRLHMRGFATTRR